MKLVLASLMALVTLSGAAQADHWRHGRGRVTVIERTSPTLGIGVAALLALQLANQAKERETIVERRAPAREYVPLK